MWGGIKETDASAAIQAWTQAVLGVGQDGARVETRVLGDVEELAGVLADGQIDAVSLQTRWFLALPVALRPAEVFVAGKGGTITERYVILSHRASGLGDVSGLVGRRLLLHDGARTSLAEPWLETVLRFGGAAGKDTERRSEVALTRETSASRTVLGVFFQRCDAGLVTAEAFATAGELNPQLRRDLRVLAESPEVVPNVFFFRKDYVGEEKARLMAAMCGLHETPEGRQLLAVFQCDQMERRLVSCLESSRLLLVEHGHLAGLK